MILWSYIFFFLPLTHILLWQVTEITGKPDHEAAALLVAGICVKSDGFLYGGEIDLLRKTVGKIKLSGEEVPGDEA